MAMWIDITMNDGTGIYLHASGDYSPDVMDDLKNRARELMNHAASVGLQVLRACNEIEAEAEGLTKPETEDVPE